MCDLWSLLHYVMKLQFFYSWSSLCSPPSLLTPFGYSALIPAVLPYSYRLDSTLTVLLYLSLPSRVVCVALLYHVLLLFSFSLNYCTLHIAWLILNSGDWEKGGRNKLNIIHKSSCSTFTRITRARLSLARESRPLRWDHWRSSNTGDLGM